MACRVGVEALWVKIEPEFAIGNSRSRVDPKTRCSARAADEDLTVGIFRNFIADGGLNPACFHKRYLQVNVRANVRNICAGVARSSVRFRECFSAGVADGDPAV